MAPPYPKLILYRQFQWLFSSLISLSTQIEQSARTSNPMSSLLLSVGNRYCVSLAILFCKSRDHQRLFIWPLGLHSWINSPSIPKTLEGKDKDRHKPAVALKFPVVEMFLLKFFKISNAQSRSSPSIPISLDSKLKDLPESLLDNIPFNNPYVCFRLSWSNIQIYR